MTLKASKNGYFIATHLRVIFLNSQADLVYRKYWISQFLLIFPDSYFLKNRRPEKLQKMLIWKHVDFELWPPET